MNDIALPAAHAAFVGPSGLPQTYWYRWCAAIDARVKDGASNGSANDEAIKTIALRLGSPDGTVGNIPAQGNAATINGSGSILVDGTLSNGVVNLSLLADALFPGSTSYYGTSPDGNRGWFPVSGALTDSVSIAVITDATTGISGFDLKPTGVTAGVYGGTALVAFTVDDQGRLVSASAKPLIAGNGISFDIDPDTGALTISVNGFVNNFRITRTGAMRVTRDGNFRITR